MVDIKKCTNFNLLSQKYCLENKIRDQRSFTLIELLVVIAIIGLLSSIVLVALTPARAKARDGRRMTEINQFYKLLEVCYSETGGYPSSDDIWDSSGLGWKYGFSCGPCYGNFDNAIKQCTDAKLKDPINVDPLAYYYFYFEPTATTYNGVSINDICKGHYALMTHLESPTYQNGICFDEPNQYEYWAVLGY
jgi:prepilin-type N-terminal cleavage/methylation domain-containing protein